MPLSIRNPKVEKLARAVAAQRGLSMTEVVGLALEDFAKKSKPDLVALGHQLAGELKRNSPGGGHRMTKDEIDEMWGQ